MVEINMIVAMDVEKMHIVFSFFFLLKILTRATKRTLHNILNQLTNCMEQECILFLLDILFFYIPHICLWCPQTYLRPCWLQHSAHRSPSTTLVGTQVLKLLGISSTDLKKFNILHCNKCMGKIIYMYTHLDCLIKLPHFRKICLL